MKPKSFRTALGIVAGLCAVAVVLSLLVGSTDAIADQQATAPSAAAEAAQAGTESSEAEPDSALLASIKKFSPILVLVLVVAIVLARLPKIEGLGHSDAFRRRR
ncbi:MAG: hypothetical protein AAGC55_15470, partial [Myxococcota bacterium]